MRCFNKKCDENRNNWCMLYGATPDNCPNYKEPEMNYIEEAMMKPQPYNPPSKIIIDDTLTICRKQPCSGKRRIRNKWRKRYTVPDDRVYQAGSMFIMTSRTALEFIKKLKTEIWFGLTPQRLYSARIFSTPDMFV